MAEIKIDTSFINNMVLVLDCLTDNEMQTARHLFESLWDLRDVKLISHRRYQRVANRSEFSDALIQVRKLCVNNWPILHIEAHGDEKHGLSIGNVQDKYAWDELADEMRLCNAACANNFGVVLAACHGRYLESQVTATKGTPFNFLVSLDGEMSALEVERHMQSFYSTFFWTVSLEDACSTLPSEMSVFRSEMYFLRQYGRHYKKMLIGKGREKAIEKLVSDMGNHQLVRQHLGMKKVRDIAKKVTAPSETKFLEQSRRFFHGRVPIPYSVFINYLRSLPPAPKGFYES